MSGLPTRGPRPRNPRTPERGFSARAPICERTHGPEVHIRAMIARSFSRSAAR